MFELSKRNIEVSDWFQVSILIFIDYNQIIRTYVFLILILLHRFLTKYENVLTMFVSRYVRMERVPFIKSTGS